jgi:sugar lactone lactonase YvrE
MQKHLIQTILILISTIAIMLAQEASPKDSTITVTPVLSLPSGFSPEGIAIDNLGNIYVSNTKGENRSINEILHVGLNGSYTVFAKLPGKGRALGLAFDSFGNLYVAYATEDSNTNGVYRMGQSRLPVRIAGSERMGKPNSLTFDDLGNLYVTDSYKGKDFEGSVWCYNKSEQVFKLFIKDSLLDGGIAEPPGPPFPLPGANGITYYPPNKLYVANTLQNSVLLITIGEFGNEPTIELVKKDYLLMNIDGIIVDENENIYGVLPPSTLGALGSSPVPPLVKLNTKSGVVSSVVEDNSKFDTPTNLSFGKGSDNQLSIFITNAALQYGQPPSAGPGVVKVQINIFGN